MKKHNKPEIRFPGFTDHWKQRKLDKILKERKVRQNISKELPLLAFASGQGVIDRSERKTNNRDFLTKDSTKKTYLLTKYDDIVYNPSNLKYGAIDRNKHGQGVISPIYVTFETDEIPSFIELIVKSENFKQRALQYEEGTVTKRQSVKPENLLCLNVVLPNSKDEQIKIGNFFKMLEDTIALRQQELTTLKQTKQGFLQKMFPKEEETVPEIRFSGFTGDWEQRKLGEILKVNSGRDYKHLQQGEIPVYGTGGYMLSVNSRLSDEDAIGIGRKGTIDKPQLLKAPFWTVDTLFFMTTKEKDDLLFCYTLASKIQWKKYDESTGVPSLSKTNIDKITIRIPALEEQSIIGNFFKQLDDTISLHQRELEILKETKKAFLQKMFV